MRVGVNPEKIKGEKNIKKQHRVIVVFYIPNITEDYYTESLEILDLCLNSLISTINFSTTNITLINNNSTSKAKIIINKYINSGKIDKYVSYNDNKGKVYAAINELRSVFEPFVTLTDGDVLFYSGWENAVFNIFKNYTKAGVVTPVPTPYMGFYSNNSIFFNNIFSRKINYKKIVSDKDIDLFLKSMNNPSLKNRNSKYNWKQKQYYLDEKVKAVVGASHFVATYKSAIFKNENKFPEIKFANGYEKEFIDDIADMNGLYRLSTLTTYAYHMGNKLDKFSKDFSFTYNNLLDPLVFKSIKTQKRNILIPFFFKKAVLKIINKLF